MPRPHRCGLVGCLALSLGAGPLGVVLVLRRMSLVGDAMAHAILPGAAVGFLVAGLSLVAMTIGGVVTGLTVALLAGFVSRLTPLREDASFAAFYLVSLGWASCSSRYAVLASTYCRCCSVPCSPSTTRPWC